MEDNAFSSTKVDNIPQPSVIPSNSPEDESRLYEAEKTDLENRLLREQLREAQNNNELRKDIPVQLWWLTVCWLIAVFLIVLFSGIKHEDFPGFFSLSYDTAVLVALITTTTASVLGLFVILLNYLYPSNTTKKPTMGPPKNNKQE